MKQKLFVFCLDALCTLDIEFIKTLPHMGKLLSEGSYVKHVEPVYPSLTYPCHCSIITGTYVDRHGVYHNEIVEVEKENAPWFNQRSDIHVPTLFDIAHKQGYTTCAISWPVSGKADIDFNMPMIVPIGYQGNDPLQFLKNNATDELLERYYWKHGRYLKGKDRNLDLFTMNLAIDILHDYPQPDIMFVKMCDLDSVRHEHGLDNDYVKEQLRKHDEEFGTLVECIKRYGDIENTNFVILGDHGQQDVQANLNMNLLLKENGFIRCDETGKLIDYDAYCHSASLSAWIQLKNPQDENMRQRIYDFLKKLKENPAYNIGYLYTKEEAKELFHLSGPFDFIIEGNKPMSFTTTLKGNDLFAKHLSEGAHMTLASHGHLPFRDETTTFIACGPAIKKGYVIERSSMVNEASTMAHMMGMDMPDTDGKPWLDLLK